MPLPTKLRRRGELKPLDARQLQDIDLQDPDPELFEILYVNPCQVTVSNDPLNPIDINPIVCNVTRYECLEAKGVEINESTNKYITTDVSIEFDYELWIRDGTDIGETVGALEGAILRHLATVIGLEDCTTTGALTASSRNGDNRQRRLQFTRQQEELILGVTSEPLDTKDDEVDNCMVPVQSSEVVGASCVPMLGSLTAVVNGDLTKPGSGNLEDGIRGGMLRLVRAGMISDTYISGPVRKVSFIGTRTDVGYAPSSAFDNDARDAGGRKGGLSRLGLALVIVGGVLILALIALMVVRRSRKRRAERGLYFVDATVIDEAEVAAVPMVPASPSAKRPRSRSNSRSTSPKRARRTSSPKSPTPTTDSEGLAGSLSSADSLALEPQGSTVGGAGTFVSPADVSPISVASSIASEDSNQSPTKAAPALQTPTTPPRTEDGDSPSPTPLTPEEVLEHLADTSSLDGANDETILNHLYNISEVDESVIGEGTDEDSEVEQALKMSPGTKSIPSGGELV